MTIFKDKESFKKRIEDEVSSLEEKYKNERKWIVGISITGIILSVLILNSLSNSTSDFASAATVLAGLMIFIILSIAMYFKQLATEMTRLTLRNDAKFRQLERLMKGIQIDEEEVGEKLLAQKVLLLEEKNNKTINVFLLVNFIIVLLVIISVLSN
jgi:uncharacterized membrane protein